MKTNWRYHVAHLMTIVDSARNNLNNQVCDSENNSSHLPSLKEALLYVGQDDKTSIPVGRTVPIAATSRQSVRAIVPMDKEVRAADHDWRAEKIVPSVTHRMNLTKTAGDLLFGGGESGNGLIYVSVHDATLDRSSSLNHTASLYNIMMMEACEALNDFTNQKMC